jgi:hypothetical protein
MLATWDVGSPWKRGKGDPIVSAGVEAGTLLMFNYQWLEMRHVVPA